MELSGQYLVTGSDSINTNTLWNNIMDLLEMFLSMNLNVHYRVPKGTRWSDLLAFVWEMKSIFSQNTNRTLSLHT